MSKYICLCGVTFKREQEGNTHVQLYEDLALAEGFSRHKIFVQGWQDRFSCWCLGLPSLKKAFYNMVLRLKNKD